MIFERINNIGAIFKYWKRLKISCWAYAKLCSFDSWYHVESVACFNPDRDVSCSRYIRLSPIYLRQMHIVGST